MGLFDRAKSSIADKFGDEIVRRGRFGAQEEEEPVEEATEPEEPSEHRRQHSRPKFLKESKGRRKSEGSPTGEPEEFRDGAFEPQNDYSFEESEPQEAAPRFQDLATDEGQSVGDILKSMGIKETFTIDDGILFVDEELASQDFAMQAPYGYDMGEVDFFLGRVQRSIAEYVKLLRVRNENVVALARRISDMAVDLNNFRFNSEIANGINIMASGGDEDALAVDLREAQTRAARLQAELDRMNASGRQPAEDSGEIERLRNELAGSEIARKLAEEDASILRSHLSFIEEEYDIKIFSDDGEIGDEPAVSGYDSYNEQQAAHFETVQGGSKPEEELYAEEASYQRVGRDHWLPDEDEGLPDYSADESLPDGDFAFEEVLEDLPLGSYEAEPGGFDQGNGGFEDSAFTPNPYQSLDEFVQDNLDGFPDDNRGDSDFGGNVGEDPDEDGFSYSFEQR